jgi:SAM-dependent methyltransferase
MKDEYNLKRVSPPIWQHDYHVLRWLYQILQIIVNKYLIKKSNVILDYGCGSSPYKDLFLPYFSKYIGVDIGENNNADILVSENEIIPLKDESVDAVVSTQVLEHVYDTGFYLTECCRLLNKNGLLILSTHGLWPYHPYPNDFHRWTREGLVKEVENYGFKCLKVYPVLGPFASTSQFTLLLIAEKLQSGKILSKLFLFLISLIGNLLIWLEDKLFPPTGKSDASLFVLCAKKI